MVRRNSEMSSQLVISKELFPGEKIAWSGTPKKGIVFRKSDVFLIPFSLFWGGFAIFWELNVLQMIGEADDPAVYVFPLFGIPFVLVGLYLIFGRFLIDAIKRSKTIYGLTDKRAIIISGLFGKRVKSLDIVRLSDVSLNEGADGRGTVLLGPETPFASMQAFTLMPANQTPQFELIENSRQVYNLIMSSKAG